MANWGGVAPRDEEGMTPVDHSHRFAEFMRGHGRRLREMDAREAADEIGDLVVSLDKRLGVELAESDDSEEREVIITAFSDPTAFDLVERLVAGLRDLSGWRFVALKPARGFDFTVAVDDQMLNAKLLEFTPLPERGAIALVVPTALAGHLADTKDSEELAWLIVETGIGENLAAHVQHLEFISADRAQVKWPIERLASYLEELAPS
jgi:hypothetical protein